MNICIYIHIYVKKERETIMYDHTRLLQVQAILLLESYDCRMNHHHQSPLILK